MREEFFKYTFDKNFKEFLSPVSYLKIQILKFRTIFVYVLRELSQNTIENLL